VATSGADTTVTSCGSFTWGDSTWTHAAGTVTYTYPTGTNSVGCDSTRDVVLTIVDYANGGAPVADSSAVNDAGNITIPVGFNYINWNSCGPVTVASGAVVDSTALANDGLPFNAYVDTVADAAGCMTLYDYEINISGPTPNADVLLSISAQCDSWTDENGTVCTADGLYSYTRTNAANGCDETVILTISGMLSSTPDVNWSMNACNDYTWNGSTYDSTGTYTQSYLNTVGCSSDSVLNLTIGSTSSPMTLCLSA
jgi:hypothetical protein